MLTMPVPCPSELPAEAGRMQPSYKFPGCTFTKLRTADLQNWRLTSWIQQRQKLDPTSLDKQLDEKQQAKRCQKGFGKP